MFFEAGGLPFHLSAASSLSDPEKSLLAPSLDSGAAPKGAWQVHLSHLDTANPAIQADSDVTLPARLTIEGRRLRATGAEFTACIDPTTRRIEVERRTSGAHPLQVALKLGLACELGQSGGFLLHAAAVVLDASAHVFFGASGSGKTYLASTAGLPVISDELVAMRQIPKGYEARGTGLLWERLRHESFPVVSAYALGSGEVAWVERMEPPEGARVLLRAVLVAPFPGIWPKTLESIARFLHAVPVHRLAWPPGDPPGLVFRRHVFQEGGGALGADAQEKSQ